MGNPGTPYQHHDGENQYQGLESQLDAVPGQEMVGANIAGMTEEERRKFEQALQGAQH